MKYITIYTTAHVPELKALYSSDVALHALPHGWAGGEYFVRIHADHLSIEPLLELMEDIVLENNPVLRGKTRLCAALKGMVNENARSGMLEELWQYIYDHRWLNIEGYTRFRLIRYECLISGMLYSAVKRGLLQNIEIRRGIWYHNLSDTDKG